MCYYLTAIRRQGGIITGSLNLLSVSVAQPRASDGPALLDTVL